MIKNKFLFFVFLFIFLVGFVSSVEVSSSFALNEINNSKLIIENMKDNGFSVAFMNDLLGDAEKAYSRAYYAEILRNKNSSLAQIQKASAVLSIVNYKNINYSEVLIYTNKIKERQNEAFRIYDLLFVYDSNLIGAKELNIDDISRLNNSLNQARVAFYDERYEEANVSLNEFFVSFEQIIEQNTSINGIRQGVTGFLSKYWVFILISLVVLVILFYFMYRHSKINYLKKKIHKMKIEELSLNQLIREVQTERFKKNSISDIVYKLRVKKYEDLLAKIKQEIPVLESNLKRLTKGK